jgi:hypothetical protein
MAPVWGLGMASRLPEGQLYDRSPNLPPGACWGWLYTSLGQMLFGAEVASISGALSTTLFCS